jgi:hypothetical protein
VDRLRKLIEAMKASAQAGRDLDLTPTDQTAGQQAAELDAALLGLSPASLDAKRSTPQFELNSLAGDVDLSNYPRRGEAIADRRAWRLYTIIAARFCGPRGCGEDTDRITVRWTVDPGRHGDRFSYTSRYFPTSSPPAFANIWATVGHYRYGYVIADENVGTDGDQDGNGSGAETLQHSSSRGDEMLNLIRLRARFRPMNTVKYDRARTGTAKCKRKRSNPACVYR